MKLIAAELASVRAQGLYITEMYDGCGKLLNRTFCYTIAGNLEVYCSVACRDLVFFGDRSEIRKAASPGKCVYCGAILEGRRRGSFFCDDICRKRYSRVKTRMPPAGVEKSRTPPQLNERVVDVKMAGYRGSHFRRAAARKKGRWQSYQRTRAAGLTGVEKLWRSQNLIDRHMSLIGRTAYPSSSRKGRPASHCSRKSAGAPRCQSCPSRRTRTSGRVFLPERASWLPGLVDELSCFPAGPHDDLVDSVTQALAYISQHAGRLKHGRAPRRPAQMLPEAALEGQSRNSKTIEF